VPRLKELSFGCKFLCAKEWEDDELIFLKKYQDTGNTTSIEYCPPKDSCSGVLNSGDTKFSELVIIGHPIDLESVLEAIDENLEDDGYAEVLHIRGGPGYYISHELKGSCVWETGKPLSEQSDETGLFLLDILK
jgi:hypothetical protein